MKQKLLTLLLMAFLPLAMMAYDTEVDGIYYNVVKKAGIAIVTSGDNPYTGEVVIPKTFVFEGKVYTVKSIGDEAFNNCSGLTNVVIPESVTSIGNSAFYKCSGLPNVVIPESVTSIGANAFNRCSSLTSVTIPNSVTSIGDSAFFGCSGLTSVTIPNSVTSISNSTFSCCSGLTSVTIPNSVTSIGDNAFEYCKGLWNVTISEGVESIGFRAFYQCDRLTSVTIPSSVTSIGEAAFQMCAGLTSVNILEGVTSIGSAAFIDCHNLTNLTIPSSLTYMDDNVILRCNSLETINVCVADYADFCFSKIKVSIPVRLIDNTGNEIKEFAIPSNITGIGDYAFYNCDGLTRVDIPSGVTSIGSEAFANCENLEVVTCYATTVPSTNTNAFDGSYVEYATLSVPDEALSDYQSTAPWSNFGTKLGSSQAVVTANSYSREYGDANPLFEYTIIGTLDGEPVISCTANENSAPGVYDIVIAQGTVTNNDVTFINGTLTIVPAPLIIRAKSYYVNLGDPLPNEYEIEYKGFKNGETEADLDEQPTASCSVSNSDTPGTYDITVSGVSNGNYDITIEDGRLYIGTYMAWGHDVPWTMKYVLQPHDTGIAPAADSSGHAWYDLDFDDSAWDNLTGPVDRLVTNEYDTYEHFGLGEGNYYNMEYENSCLYLRRTFTISPSAYESMPDWLMMNMEADDVADIYLNGQLVGSNRDKGSWYSFGVNKSAFVAGDNLLAIYYYDDSGEAYLDYELRVPDADNHVFYTDTQGVMYELNNDQTAWSVTCLSYRDESKTSIEIPSSLFDLPVTQINEWAFNSISYLTSISLPSTITAVGDYAFGFLHLDNLVCNAETPPSCGEQVFDGADVSNTVLIVPSSSVNAYTTTEPWSYFGTITSLSTTVTANSYTREYGDPYPEFEWTVEGMPLDGTPSVTCTADESSAPGVYDIVIEQGTVTNANVTYVNGTLTITKAPLTITAKSYTINEGDAMPNFEVEYDGFKNDETADDLTSQPTISCTASDTYTEGIYDITVSGAASDNYDISYVAGKLTVAPTDAHITITSAGMGTYCSPYDLDLTGVTALKAYTITGYDKANSRVYATRVYDVPAGTGLYLVGNPGDYDVPISTSNSYYINMLVGTLEQTWIDTTDGDLTNLRLTGTNPSNASFKILSEGRNFSANRAYLQIPTYILGNTANAATAFGIVLDDDTNGIEDIMLNSDDTDSEWYTLDGRKLNGKPTARGIYVVKGRKVVVK